MRVSALLPAGSFVVNDPAPAGGVVGGEWACKSGLSGAPGRAQSGLNSSGLGLFGSGDRFPGPDLEAPASPNGVEYGIVSSGYVAGSGNAGIRSTGLIDHGVIFTLETQAGCLFSSGNLSAVSFQYGTALAEPRLVGTEGGGSTAAVPLPAAAWLLGSGLLAIGSVRRKRITPRPAP